MTEKKTYMSNTLELDTNLGVTTNSDFPRVIRRDLPH